MATLTLYFKDAASSGSHRSLQVDGSPPAAATTGTGWTINAVAAGQTHLMSGGTMVPADDAGWSTTARPTSGPANGDSWRSENVFNGTFTAGDWWVWYGLRSSAVAYDGRLRLACRIWRSTNADGTGAVQITSGRVTTTPTTTNFATNSDKLLYSIITLPEVTLSNEYLWINIAVEITTQGATGDVAFRVGVDEVITTPEFTESAARIASATITAGDATLSGTALSGGARVRVGWAALRAPESTYVNRIRVGWAALRYPATIGGGELPAAQQTEPLTTSDVYTASRLLYATVEERTNFEPTDVPSFVTEAPETWNEQAGDAVTFSEAVAFNYYPSGLTRMYPSFPQWEGTRMVPRPGIMERVATNGSIRLRALQSSTKYDIQVVHGMLSVAQRLELLDFYDANRLNSFLFAAVEDGSLHTCVFAAGDPFRIEPIPGYPNMYVASVNLREA